MSIWDDPAEVQGKANVESMFWAADEGVPWHGLGTPVPTAITTAAEALEASGQGWTVSVEQLITTSGIAITDGRRCKAIVRDDTRTVLGVVGQRYKPIQNAEAFDFLDSLAAERVIRYHTAGVLGRGERIWILAQLHGDIKVAKDDVVKKFLLFSNNHDGTASARCLWTPVRVVCANTLNQAVNGSKGEGVVIRHTGSLEGKIQEAQRILGLAVRMYDDLEGQFKASAKFKMTDTMRATYFASLFGPGPKGNDEDGTTEEASAKTRKTLDRLHELAETGRGNGAKPVKGSLWSSYNAVTDFIDHERGTRVSNGADGSKRGDEPSKRFESSMFGQGAQVKERAWTLARAIMDDPAVLNAVPVPSTN
jgi:phage/plasmid-like protein (TIGR03299 family)